MSVPLSKRMYAAQVEKVICGAAVTLAGWAQDIRNLGKISFIILRDRTGLTQLVLKKTPNFNRESVIAVKGTINQSKSKQFKNEVLVKDLEVLSHAEAPLPIEFMKGGIETSQDKRLDWRSIDLHNPERSAIFLVQSKLVEGATKWFIDNGFVQVFTPCLMGVPSESGAEMFSVPYFGQRAFLRQDPQLHRQLTILGGIERLVDIGPSWRAEKSHTRRHICEHRGIAPEMAFISNELDTMRVEENVIISALKQVKKDCKRELSLLGKKIELPSKPFPELRFPDIYKILEDKFKRKLSYGEDIDEECERLLSIYVKKKYGSDFFFLNRFPFAKKPFYVMRVDDDPDWARSVDLIYRGTELSSGGQREHRYDKLMENVKAKGMSPQSVEWFTKFFKYGAPPHGGFGLGIERLTMQALELPNIREAVLFPRDPGRLTP